ncbi:hypothetical protein BaRGS_00000755 [Batillaria attramentaria]|uniref:Uncharacterized protein n=1 Tax=Batillaria attramentaria TaxID=370345 RepID=A0ABD0M7U0_9CAEN
MKRASSKPRASQTVACPRLRSQHAAQCRLLRSSHGLTGDLTKGQLFRELKHQQKNIQANIWFEKRQNVSSVRITCSGSLTSVTYCFPARKSGVVTSGLSILPDASLPWSARHPHNTDTVGQLSRPHRTSVRLSVTALKRKMVQ